MVIKYGRRKKGGVERGEEMEKVGVKALVVKGNVGEGGKIKDMFEEMEEGLGRVEVLVKNGGWGVLWGVMELEERDWEWRMNMNGKGVVLWGEEGGKVMEKRGGGEIVRMRWVG